MIYKTFKAIIFEYADNHKRDTYKLYNTETKRVIMNRDVKWADWKMDDPAETLKMSHKENEEYLVPGIEEEIIPTSETEDNIPVHIIPDKGEIVRPNEIYKIPSELMHHKKYIDADTSEYDRVLNKLKNLDTL